MQYGKKDYEDAWAAYKEALLTRPSLHLSSFCAENGYLICSMRKWMRRHGVSLKQAKDEVREKQMAPVRASADSADFVEIRMPECACGAPAVRIDGMEIKVGLAMIHIDHMECGDLGALLKTVLPCSR